MYPIEMNSQTRVQNLQAKVRTDYRDGKIVMVVALLSYVGSAILGHDGLGWILFVVGTAAFFIMIALQIDISRDLALAEILERGTKMPGSA